MPITRNFWAESLHFFFQKNTGVFPINIAFFCRNRLDYRYLGVMKVEIGSTENFRNHHEDSFDIEYLPV